MENKTKHGLTSLEVNRATTVLKKYFEYEYCQEFSLHLNQPNTFDLNDLATAAEYELNCFALCRSSMSKFLRDVDFIRMHGSSLLRIHRDNVFGRERLWGMLFKKLDRASWDNKAQKFRPECVEVLTQFTFNALQKYIAENFTREDYAYLETVLDENKKPYAPEMLREFATDYFNYVFSRYVSA
ncbi:hypothetical protein AT434_004640 [Escherichia coli]